jgi:protein O-GlcNAc transferase
VPSELDQAFRLHRQGRLRDAEEFCRRALERQPREFAALHLLGALRLQQDQPEEAIKLIAAALELEPGSAVAHANYGLALAALRRPEEALASYAEALRINPQSADALANQGDAYCDLGRPQEGLASYDRALAINPRLVGALVNRGLALYTLGQRPEALQSHERALAVDPDNAEAWNNRGTVLQELGREREALASYERALKLRPDYVEALFNRGNVLLALKRLPEALVAYADTLARRPDFAEAYCNRGHVLADMRRFEEALASYEKAAALRPDYVDALINHAAMHAKLDRHREALTEYEALRSGHPEITGLAKEIAGCCAAICQWSTGDKLVTSVLEDAVSGRAPADPFMLLGFEATPAQHLAASRNWLRRRKIEGKPREWSRGAFSADRLRVAYLSADYHRHVTAHLIAELFELHDRSRFEIIGISFGPNERSELRSRLIKSFDRFHDVTTRTDEEVAALVRSLNCHIAVDLKGHTTDARIGILAQRAAPIQASYLGFPGTTGADFMDYVIADRIVLPFDQQEFYTEKIVHLPDSYQVNDRKRPIASTSSRSEVGLTEDAFVFCCFNNSWKLNSALFDLWMRLIAAVPKSVLWLFEPNAAVADNLRREAGARGVDPGRLLFAPPLDLPMHLARLAHADLFLDTLPYNAHTTASDALWMGVPVITCSGGTFAGRVAASLLDAAGLPELVTSSLDEYETLALRLATEPGLSQPIRAKLRDVKTTCRLFDTDRFRQGLESAYTTMWEIWQRGEPPRSFSVDPPAIRS